MTSEQVQKLLASEEVETIERKKGLDPNEVCQALIAFANDLAERGCGWLILGQGPDKSIVGLKMGKDRAQQRVADIARNRCKPAIPVSIEPYEVEGKTILIVEARTSVARPHFDGDAWVRIGSTTRRATDSEIVLMRAAQSERKVALAHRWLRDGKKEVVLVTVESRDRCRAALKDVTEDWVVLDLGGKPRAIPWGELTLSYDYENDRPEIRDHGRMR